MTRVARCWCTRVSSGWRSTRCASAQGGGFGIKGAMGVPNYAGKGDAGCPSGATVLRVRRQCSGIRVLRAHSSGRYGCSGSTGGALPRALLVIRCSGGAAPGQGHGLFGDGAQVTCGCLVAKRLVTSPYRNIAKNFYIFNN